MTTPPRPRLQDDPPDPAQTWRQPPRPAGSTRPGSARSLGPIPAERPRQADAPHRGLLAVGSVALAVGLVAGALGLARGAGLVATGGRDAPGGRSAPATTAPRAAASWAGASADPALTQRKGEWSVICAKTGQPLVDFSPVDRGRSLNRVVLTVHNCSTKPVSLKAPIVWLGGKEAQSDHLPLDRERTKLSKLSLAPYESAQAILSWEPPLDADGGVLSVDFPGIGQGEVREPLGLDLQTRTWISGWTT